jgi:hypothetical protein
MVSSWRMAVETHSGLDAEPASPALESIEGKTNRSQPQRRALCLTLNCRLPTGCDPSSSVRNSPSWAWTFARCCVGLSWSAVCTPAGLFAPYRRDSSPVAQRTGTVYPVSAGHDAHSELCVRTDDIGASGGTIRPPAGRPAVSLPTRPRAWRPVPSRLPGPSCRAGR